MQSILTYVTNKSPLDISTIMTQALEKIKVIDLSRILAGPWASQMLADLGAEVIKIEKPGVGDDTRSWGPPFVLSSSERADAAYFHCTNRNKQSVAVDIRTSEGQALIKALLKDADVLIENYKVGGLAKYGLDYQSVKELNPRLVYCSITGFGQSGPWAHKAGYDAMIQGEGGLMSITGEPDGLPMKVGVALVDVMTGLYSCNGILAALMARHRTGKGQLLDIALLDVQMAALANQGMNYLVTGENPPRLGNGHPNIVPYQTFKTKDGAMILAVGNDQQFAKFCRLVQRADLSDHPKFSTNQQRVANRDELLSIISTILKSRESQWWLTELEKISVPCGAVNTIKQVVTHPQTKHRNMVQTLTDANGQEIKSIASPINLSDTPVQYQHAAPALGQHTESVLQALGYDSEAITRLKANGIVQ